MTRHASSALSSVFAACLLITLSACGGGGGGGGGGGNDPPPSTARGGFTLGANTVTMNARTDEPSVIHRSIPLQLNDATEVATVGAAYVAPNVPAGWLFVSITGSGANYSVELDAAWVGTPAGTYTAVVTIGTANASGAVLQRRDITVTLTVTEITVRPATGPFNERVTFGHSTVTQTFDVFVNAPAGRAWTVTSNAAWLQAPSTVYTGAATVPVVLNATGLAMGNHTGQLQFTAQGSATDNTVRAVTLSVLTPTLRVGSAQVTLGGDDGNASRQANVTASLDTGTNSYPVTLTPVTTTGGNWLSASSAAANIGTSDITLSLAANASIGTPGRYDGAVQVDASVLGQTIRRTINVRYNQDQDKLVAATLGAAFSHFPSRSVLRRSIRIYDAMGRTDIPWTASDDASWLTVTASGNTGGEVLLVADPTGLATNQTHYATVTVASSSPLIDNDQRIRVGLKVGSTNPVVTSLTQVAVSVVANPVDPVVYVALDSGPIEVRDVHTGALVNTFNVLSADGGYMAISDDGLTLFAIDGWSTQRVLVLNAQTGAVLGEFPLRHEYTTTLHYLRPNAHPVLISGHGEAFDVVTRTGFDAGIDVSTYYPSNKFAHTGDQRFLFSQQRAHSGAYVDKARIGWSTLVTPALVTEYLFSSLRDEAADDVCVSADDSRLMTSGERIDTPFNLLNTSDLSVAIRLPASTYRMSNVACLWNGLYMGSTSFDGPNLFFYDAQGNGIASQLLYQANHEPMRDRIIVSGDASRVIAVTGGPSFHTSFFNAPQVP